MDFFYTLLLNAFFASIASTGFAMVFNVPKHTLKYCALGGAITFTTKDILLNVFGMQIELASFFTATFIGIIAFYWSRKHLIPRPVYTVASIIPIIPGTYALSAVICLVDINSHGVSPELMNTFIENALKAMSILGAISFGIALPSLYFIRLNRPVI